MLDRLVVVNRFMEWTYMCACPPQKKLCTFYRAIFFLANYICVIVDLKRTKQFDYVAYINSYNIMQDFIITFLKKSNKQTIQT